METSPLPNEDSGQSDSGSSVYDEDDFTNVYVVRMTPYDKYTLDELKAYLSEMDCSSWVLGVESKPQIHYHLVIEHDDDLNDLKLRIRSFLDKYWPPGQRARGFGNKQYNCQICDDKQKAISYAIKERTYEYYGYDPDYIESLLEKSFTKNAPGSFNVELKLLNERFTDIRQYMIDFMILKAKYGQQVNPQTAWAFANSIAIKHDPDYSRVITDDFLSRH